MATVLDRNRGDLGDRPNVLLMAISYPDVEMHMEKHGFDKDILDCPKPCVEQAVECVRRGVLTEMDARDLARCVATEEVCDVNVFSTSREIGAVYREDRHIYADFNNRNFCKKLKEAFGDDVQFSQIILDYYWMPTGWLVTRWAKTLFQRTLPDLVRNNLLKFPNKRRPNSTFEEGTVMLPFCAHVCKELVGGIHILKDYYAISFITKDDLPQHSLWRGTMDIDGEIMQTRLGKRLDQEEVYCTFDPKDIYKSMEDAHIDKADVMRVLLAIEDYDNIRMIKLRPLRQHEPQSISKESLMQPEVGGFVGLNYKQAEEKLKRKPAKSAAVEKEAASKNAKKKNLAKDVAKNKKKQAKKRSAPPSKHKKKATKTKKTSVVKNKRRRPKKKEKEIGEDEVNDSSSEESHYAEADDEDEVLLGDISDVTWYFPEPALDLQSYLEFDPRQDDSKPKEADSVELTEAGDGKPKEVQANDRQLRSKKPPTKTVTRTSIKATKDALSSAAKVGFQDLESLRIKGPQYLSFNPRRIPAQLKPSGKNDKGKYVEDLYEHVKTDGNAKLLDMAIAGNEPRDKAIVEPRCFRIKKDAVINALQNSSPTSPPPKATRPTDQEDYDVFEETRVFNAALRAYRGDWESSFFDEKTVQKIAKAKDKLRSCTNSIFDRSILLDTVLRWLTFEREPSLDPSGELGRIYDLLKGQGKLDRLHRVKQAKFIESTWYLMGKTNKKNLPGKEPSTNTAKESVGDCNIKLNSAVEIESNEETATVTCSESDDVAGADQVSDSLVTTNAASQNTFDRVLKWLVTKDGPTPSEKNRDFEDLDRMLFMEAADQSVNERAKEIANHYELRRSVDRTKEVARVVSPSPLKPKDPPTPAEEVVPNNREESPPASPRILPLSSAETRGNDAKEPAGAADCPIEVPMSEESDENPEANEFAEVSKFAADAPFAIPILCDESPHSPQVLQEESDGKPEGNEPVDATETKKITGRESSELLRRVEEDSQNSADTGGPGSVVSRSVRNTTGAISDLLCAQSLLESPPSSELSTWDSGTEGNATKKTLGSSNRTESLAKTDSLQMLAFFANKAKPPPRHVSASKRRKIKSAVTKKSSKRGKSTQMDSLAFAGVKKKKKLLSRPLASKESKRAKDQRSYSKCSRSLSRESKARRGSNRSRSQSSELTARSSSQLSRTSSKKKRPASARHKGHGKFSKPTERKKKTPSGASTVQRAGHETPPALRRLHTEITVDPRIALILRMAKIAVADYFLALAKYEKVFGGERAGRFHEILYGLASRQMSISTSQGAHRIKDTLRLKDPLIDQAVRIESHFYRLNMECGLDWPSRVGREELRDRLFHPKTKRAVKADFDGFRLNELHTRPNYTPPAIVGLPTVECANGKMHLVPARPIGKLFHGHCKEGLKTLFADN